MDITNLTPIVDQLKSRRTQLSDQRIDSQRQLMEIERELGCVDDAISALTSKDKPAAKHNKPSPNRAAVREAVRSCLAEQGQMAEAELKVAVGKKLASNGFSRSGLALRLKEVLSEEEFLNSADCQASRRTPTQEGMVQ